MPTKKTKTTEYKTSFKKPKKKEHVHTLTLDEYDELTLQHQGIGAAYERGNIVAELTRRAEQLRHFSEAADLTPSHDVFAQEARGVEMAIRLIEKVRKYEDNVGCPECEAGW